jgi:hypothetical protein
MATSYEGSEKRSEKVLMEMKEIKIKDIMMIYKFKELLEVNEKNVKKFKKFAKQNEYANLDKFEAEALPDVNEFSNSAIVRFFNNKEHDTIMKTVEWKWYESLINYFFPFYHPPSQYQILGRNISIESAPEPTDIQWGNFGYTEILRIGRKILCSFLAFLLLLLSAAFSFSLLLWIQTALTAHNTQPVVLSIVTSAVSLIYNIILQEIIAFLIRIIYLDTVTD